MTLKLLLQLCAALLLPLAACAQGIGFGPPPVPTLNDAVMMSGTSVLGSDGRNWAYIVWQSPAQTTLQGRAFSVYLQAEPNAAFSRQAIITPTTDVPTLNLLLSRAAALHADNEELEENLLTLLRRKSWLGVQAAAWENKPLVEKLSAVLARAQQSAEAYSAVAALAPAHPALRMALARAWAGSLPVGNGPMVIELREWLGATDGGVIGRVTLTPGQGVSLVSPGMLVQVPDLKPVGDLSIRLRWAVPDALRRQQQHLLGFRVYRIYEQDAVGLSLSAGTQDIVSWVAAHANVVQAVNDAPVPIGQLFSNTDVADFSEWVGDRSTSFITDTDRRNDLMTDDPQGPRYPGFPETGRSCIYYVAAVDLLGRVGPPSPLCVGKAVRTIPPDVPRELRVVDQPVGNTRYLSLRWRANDSSLLVPGRSTAEYAIYRGDVPNDTASSLSSLENPGFFKYLSPIAIVPAAQAVNGYLTYTDTSVQPASGNVDRSVWYAVTALSTTPLDSWAGPPWFFEMNPHERVQSAPSAPAFGIFRDRTGPAAPTGGLYANADKVYCHSEAPQVSPRSASGPDSTRIHLRSVCRRRDRGISKVRFIYTDNSAAGLPPNGQVGDSLVLLFPPDQDELTHEISLPLAACEALQIACVASTPDGVVNTATTIFNSPPEPDPSEWNLLSFTAGRYACTEFASDSTTPIVAGFAAVKAFTSVVDVSPGVKRMHFAPGALTEGVSIVLQRSIPLVGVWASFATVQVHNNSVLFAHDPASPVAFLYRAQEIRQGTACPLIHNARPKQSTTIQPVDVFVDIPATTKEWRIYRSADGGPMALLKSGIVDLTQGMTSAVMAQDKAMPPSGAEMRYFAQCFDQNNNGSPLKFLGAVKLLPDPATPVLNTPKSVLEGGEERVTLKWFCPTPGVTKFQIYLLAFNYSPTLGKPVAITPGLTSVAFGSIDNVALTHTQLVMAGSNEKKSVPIFYAFDTGSFPLGSNGPSLHEATFRVTPGVNYLAWISAVGVEDLIATTSKAHEITWKQPVVTPPNAEPLVAWPARPLPPVVPNPGGGAVLLSNHFDANGDAYPGFYPERSSISNATAAELYPVAVFLGLLPQRAEIRGETTNDVYGLFPPITFDKVEGPLASPPADAATDPMNYLTHGTDAFVLYRQTILPSGPGALVQVSPLRETIAWKRETLTSTTADLISHHSLLKDPFIKVMTYDFGPSQLSYLALVDTHSVEAGATYHYYLATYTANGELKTVYDCHSITIPED